MQKRPLSVSLHRYKLPTRWLQTPVLSRAGHIRCHSTADTPSQLDKGPPDSPDISILSQVLQEQWHVAGNMHLGAIKIKPSSRIKAVWQCNKCPAGQPHVWTTAVISRTPGTSCPYCRNRLVCVHNSLATVAPEVAQYWDLTRNEQAPEQVLAGSGSRAAWKCPACQHEWQALIHTRVYGRSGCPKCSRAGRVVHPLPTFAEAQPAELAEWDHGRNEAEGFFPHKVTLGSSKPLHWICLRCPRGQPRRWTAKPVNRIGNGGGCPACAGKQVCVCNSLESLFPLLATEFDVDKNGFASSEITAFCHKRVWWKSAKRSWKGSVQCRTDRRRLSHTQRA